jgi:hypothetical protein
VEQLDRRISAESREVSEALQEFVESNTGRKMGIQLELAPRIDVGMAKSKSPPEIPASLDQLMELAPLLMDLYDLVQTTNGLDNIDPISTMILATVTVGDAYNDPMTAEDSAFCLDTPLRTVKSKLKRLMKTGIIEMDGECYRYNPPRGFTPDEQRRMNAIKRAFDELHPTLVKRNRLDS